MERKKCFNGKDVYTQGEWYSDKREAVHEAIKIRKNGYLARVIPAVVDRRYHRYYIYRTYTKKGR